MTSGMVTQLGVLLLVCAACTTRAADPSSNPNRPNQLDPDAGGVGEQVCGNGATEGSETCDDGNTVDGDECPANCGATVCGDGVCEFDRGEGCNTCVSDCSAQPQCNNAVCGDGVCALGTAETCENCAADCATLPACTVGACGDGKIAGQEECDDGNFNSFDGCSALCKVEASYKCDGEPSRCGRAPAALGEVIFTEVMANPAAVEDSLGEWIEVYNTTDDILNLEGVSIVNDGSQSATIGGVAIIQPGAYLVLGVNGDTTTNGGVPVDVEYAGLALDDAGEVLTMQIGTLVLDSVKLANAAKAPPAGTSFSLDPSKLTDKDNDPTASWCGGASTFGAGDKGSPGAANATCPAPPPGVFLSDMANASIPDDSVTGLSRTLTANRPGCLVQSVDVDVEIKHTFIGDVWVRLVGPTGKVVSLHALSAGGSADDLIGNYPATLTPAGGATALAAFNGLDANGVWTLRVTDEDAGISGTLVSWGINIYCQ